MTAVLDGSRRSVRRWTEPRGPFESPRNPWVEDGFMDLRDDMLGRLQSRRARFTLPQPFYIDPGYFRLDMEMIWYREWLFVGHECEIDKPGSFFTVQIGDYTVVLVR